MSSGFFVHYDEGVINNLKVLRDGYVMEIFLNGGEEVCTVLL